MERIDLHYWERVAGGGCAIWEYGTRFQTRDANLYDDRMLYTSSNRWLQQKYITGRAVGKDPITFTYAYLRFVLNLSKNWAAQKKKKLEIGLLSTS
ncbi:hypothetical protein E1A91_D03G017400v1 [Gossypium mustelinum]|uniref:Uncharacterized protein n=1 Tax=Gossypium mustelinum TaxID=34275 RepID=A0A5D2VHL1_GOSMU|nr:hypothetical protein E1A91_D03G017400v1 [Gossypium mustelinum]